MGGTERRPTWLAADTFFVINILLFVGMCWFVYYDRFRDYRGAGNVDEFFVYAAAILLAMLAGWMKLRLYAVPARLLILMQFGICFHFAGAFFPIEGGRLYDAAFFGIRFDKFVHAFNAFAGAALISHLIAATGSRIAFRGIILTLAVLGAGAVIEILEFGVTLTVPHNGVGTYENNMGDMVANLAGALIHEACHLWQVRQRSRRETAPAFAVE